MYKKIVVVEWDGMEGKENGAGIAKGILRGNNETLVKKMGISIGNGA